MTTCPYCKKHFEWNPKIILRQLTNMGYQDKEFCEVGCFLRYVLKKFKRGIKKLTKF